MLKSDLYAIAQNRNIEGRSNMTKPQLRRALLNEIGSDFRGLNSRKRRQLRTLRRKIANAS